MNRELRAALLLFASTSQRMFREGLILRSLVFPTLLTAGTLVAVLAAASLLRPPPDVALSPDERRPELVAWFAEHRWPTHVEKDLRGAIRGGTASAAIEGNIVLTRYANEPATVAEAALRDVLQTPWRIDPNVDPPGAAKSEEWGLLIGRLIASIFALYGGVFGAGAIARDQDDGTLDAERTLPIRPWVHGAVRWAAASAVLSAFAIPGIALFDALMGVTDLQGLSVNTVAACMATSALGIGSVGRSGLKSGFSTALALSLSFSAGLGALRIVAPSLAAYIPVASLYIESNGWISLLVASALGVVAVARCARALGDG